MTNIDKNNQKKGKPKMFLLFLFVAAFIWFLSKYSRDFMASVVVKIEYVNVPPGVVVTEKNKKYISLDLITSGFDFLFYKINNPVIYVDIGAYYTLDETTLLIPPEDFKRLLINQLNNDVLIKDISINKFEIFLDTLDIKKVKVTLRENITFAEGYKPFGAHRIIPDSIKISGPAHQLDTLNEIFTSLLSISNVAEDIATTITLTTALGENLTFEKNEVVVNCQVKEFTQKSLLIPLTLKNLPTPLKIKLLPENIAVVFEVSVENFNKIDESDFLIEIDYDRKNEEENYMIPQLIKFPETVLNIELRQEKVNYLIFK